MMHGDGRNPSSQLFLRVPSIILALALCSPLTAAAQETGFGESNSSSASSGSSTSGTSAGVAGKMRLHVFGVLGFGGEASGEIDFDNDEFPIDDSDFDDLDLETTNGVGAQFDYALHRYFLLGGRLEFNFVDVEGLYGADEDDDDRSLFVNIDVVPKGRLPIAGAPIEFYLAVPVGPTVNFPNDDLEDDFGNDTDFDTGISWNLSLHAGVQYWFNSTIGVFVEQGWYHQAFQFPGDTQVGNQRADFVTTGDFDQFSVNFGLSIGL